MSFFQAPFGEEFRQKWPIGQDVTIFIGANSNNIGQPMISWNTEPYNFSMVNILNINFAYDPDRKNYSTVSIDVAGAIPAATLAVEVSTILNANATFATYFIASILNSPSGPVTTGPPYRVSIAPRKGTSGWQKQNLRFYISNGNAESILQFNQKAPVKELPTYFARHTVANRFNYPDCQACLVELDPANPVDAAVITAAGLNPLVVQTDWELLHGRSIGHSFKKTTQDGSNRVTTIIEYPAGAVAGDMGKKVQYTYTGTNVTPDQITEVPYVLTIADLVTPP